MWSFVIFMLLLATPCSPWRLTAGPYVLLPDENGCRVLDRGVANKASYDPETNLLYVIGTRRDVIHVVDMNNPHNPVIRGTREFHEMLIGLPDSVKVCRHGTRQFLAVTFEMPMQTEKAHVHFYNLLQPNEGVHDLTMATPMIVLDGYDPTAIAWSSDCSQLLVVSAGEPHILNNVFVDPEASVEVLAFGTGNSVDRTPLTFTDQQLNDANVRRVFRTCDSGSETHESSRQQDLEPKAVHVDRNDIAYVVFQENNAFAKMDMSPAVPRSLEFFSFGYIDRSTNAFDGSYDDGGINLATRKLRALYQPSDIQSFELNGKLYLVTADQGSIRRYNFAQCQFDESLAGRAWLGENSFADGLTSSEQTTLRAELNDNTRLGRLRVSNVKTATDGWDSVFGGYDFVCTFGGRGFSIWDPSQWVNPGDTPQPVYSSGDDFERFFETADDRHKAMYNALYGNPRVTQSSTFDRESVERGPAPSAVAAAEFNDTTLLAIANGKVGGLYLYQVTPGLQAGIQVNMLQYLRRGNPALTWTDAYGTHACTSSNSKPDQMVPDDPHAADVGEPNISDLLYIEDDGNRMFVAVSDTAGSLSIYFLNEH